MGASIDTFKKYPNKYFVETGTCLGDGVYQAIDAGFQIIISIELSEELYNICVKKFRRYPNVILYNGDSTEVLWGIIKDITDPITFWLDAHYSGGASGNKIITAHNNKIETPVLEELEIIAKHPIKTHTILIDDARSFMHLPIIRHLYDINKHYNISFIDGAYKKDIIVASLIESERKKGVIQVGAHYGEEYEEWVANGAENFIFFEPSKASYDKLIDILPKSDNIKTFNMALGNSTGEVEMYIETSHQGKSSSVLKPKGHLEQYPDITFEEKETVKIDKLDNIEYDDTLYDHLHIDTQGYELEVLRGAIGSLGCIKTIQVEVYREELYEGCPMIDEVVGFLFGYGFILESVKWRSETWGDCYLRKY